MGKRVTNATAGAIAAIEAAATGLKSSMPAEFPRLLFGRSVAEMCIRDRKWVVMLAPLAFIMLFSFKAENMSAASARTMFFVFAAVMGVSMSSILVVFTGASVVRVFFFTAAAFGALSLVGYTTKKSLPGMGSFLIMGLIGLILSLIHI